MGISFLIKRFGFPFLFLLAAFFLSSGARQAFADAVLFDDDFAGAQDSALNASKWTIISSGTTILPKLDGSGHAVFSTDVGSWNDPSAVTNTSFTANGSTDYQIEFKIFASHGGSSIIYLGATSSSQDRSTDRAFMLHPSGQLKIYTSQGGAGLGTVGGHGLLSDFTQLEDTPYNLKILFKADGTVEYWGDVDGDATGSSYARIMPTTDPSDGIDPDPAEIAFVQTYDKAGAWNFTGMINPNSCCGNPEVIMDRVTITQVGAVGPTPTPGTPTPSPTPTPPPTPSPTPYPPPVGGGEFILLDNFNGTTPAANVPWEGSAPQSVRTRIEFVRSGYGTPQNGRGHWEHWPKAASSAAAYYDGQGNVKMEMVAAPWQSYLDARSNGSTTTNAHTYTGIGVVTMPATGGGALGIGFSDGGGTYFKGFKLVDGTLYWHNTAAGGLDANVGSDLNLGAYTPGQKIGLMYVIGPGGAITLYKQTGTVDPWASGNWTNITPSGNPAMLTYAYRSEVFSVHTLAAATDPEPNPATVDMVAWLEDSNVLNPPAPTASPTPTPGGGKPSGISQSWYLYE